MHALNPSSGEEEASMVYIVTGQPGLYRETPPQNKTKFTHREREREGWGKRVRKKERKKKKGREERGRKKAQLHCTALYSQPSLGHSMEFSAHIEDGSFPV